jgi:hypothetical protein
MILNTTNVVGRGFMRARTLAKSLSVLFLFSPMAHAKSVRAVDMTPAMWSTEHLKNGEETVVEFHKGDEIVISFAASGSFIETKNKISGPVEIKQDFWLKLTKRGITASFNGHDFASLGQLASGSLSVGTLPPGTETQNALGIGISFQADARPASASITGVGLTLEKSGDMIIVDELVAGSPAELSHLVVPGDRVLAVQVNGDLQGPWTPIAGLSLEEVVQLIRGPEATLVGLRLVRNGVESTLVLTRQKLSLPARNSNAMSK